LHCVSLFHTMGKFQGPLEEPRKHWLRDRPPVSRTCDGICMKKPPSWYVQSAALPLWEDQGETHIVLVTSCSSKRWIIPKGIVQPEMTSADSAAKEAWEEAGVRGSIEPQPVGTYQYEKWGGICTVAVHILNVTEILPEWPEGHVRERAFVSFHEAIARVREPELKNIIERCFETI